MTPFIIPDVITKTVGLDAFVITASVETLLPDGVHQGGGIGHRAIKRCGFYIHDPIVRLVPIGKAED